MAEKILPENQQSFTRILLLALDLGQYDMERSLEELTALAQANRMEVAAQIVQKRDAPETGTVLGAGKLEEARLYAMNLEAEAAVFDGELTGSQIRNLSDALGIEVLDRTMLILEIFRSRGRQAADRAGPAALPAAPAAGAGPGPQPPGRRRWRHRGRPPGQRREPAGTGPAPCPPPDREPGRKASGDGKAPG